MLLGDVLTVKEAADRLEIPASQVRALIARGGLPAERLGRVWLIPTDAIEMRIAAPQPVGRPFSQRIAWAVLCISSEREVPYRLAREETRRSIDYANRRLEINTARLRGRATLARLSVSASAVEELVQDPSWLKGGRYAANSRTARGASSDIVDLYVRADQVEELSERYHAVPDGFQPNVIVHSVHGRYWCFEDEESGVVWPMVGQLDLADRQSDS